MNAIRKHLFLATLGIIVVAMLVGGGAVITKTYTDARQYCAEVAKIQESMVEFKKAPFALTNQDVQLAGENAAVVDKAFGDLMAALRERVVPTNEERARLSRVRAMSYIRQVCTKMENQLRGEEIEVPETLTFFSFDYYRDPKNMPKKDEIPIVVKQLEIVQELIYLISQSQVKRLDGFARETDADLETVSRDLYDYVPFYVTISGPMESIQRFLRSLNQARYLFLVRSMELMAPPNRMDNLPGLPAAEPATPDSRGVAVPPGTRPSRRGPEGYEYAEMQEGYQAGTGRPEAYRGRRPNFPGLAPNPRYPARPTSTTPGAAATEQEPETPRFLSKDERVVFEEPAVVTARIIVDYVEFHEKE